MLYVIWEKWGYSIIFLESIAFLFDGLFCGIYLLWSQSICMVRKSNKFRLVFLGNSLCNKGQVLLPSDLFFCLTKNFTTINWESYDISCFLLIFWFWGRDRFRGQNGSDRFFPLIQSLTAVMWIISSIFAEESSGTTGGRKFMFNDTTRLRLNVGRPTLTDATFETSASGN